jgi:toxin HigB-1
VIRSFADRETEKVHHREVSRRIPVDVQASALRKLRMLSNARELRDLRSPPENRLERLTGVDLAGRYSARINEQWRICFAWQDGDAFDVEIVDYC